jgi:DEAD/DEAH box helicase domain-containing protein
LQATEGTLSDVTINTRAESELEVRFLEKLREGKGLPDGVRASLRDDVINGRKGYLLTLSIGNSATSWKLEQQVSLGESEGVGVYSRADFLLTPTAGGKPIAIYTDGWEYHRGRLATDAQQRMALQRSGSYLFWGLTWDDVVEKPPSLQHPLQPNALEAMVPVFVTRPELFSRWWPDHLLEQLPKSAYAMAPRQVQIAGSFQLLMHLLLNPSERWWQGLAQQLAQAQLQPRAITAPELTIPTDALQLTSHVQEWQAAADGQRVGQHMEVAPGLSVLNLGAMELHMQRHPAASFRAIHFDPEQAGHEPQQQAAWREWIRQSNLFQFLPHVVISTPGWGGAEQSSAVGPYSVWLSGEPNPSGSIQWASPDFVDTDQGFTGVSVRAVMNACS